MTFFRARLDQYQQARIYHYAPYEITALRRLTTKCGIGEAYLDRLLREGRFVDLYAVELGGVVAAEKNYSIKSLEVFYGLKRQGEVKTAGGSVVAYEAWRDSGDQTILNEIMEYNRVDCISTEMLRDWLVSIRPKGPWPSMAGTRAETEVAEDADTTALRAMLAASGLPQERQDMLFNLGLFHKREAKLAWWSVFDSLNREDDELIDDLDDLDALGGLQALGPVEPVKRSVMRRYSYPAQETKLRVGKKPVIPAPDGMAEAEVLDMDRTRREITLKVGPSKAGLLTDRLTLHPAKPIGADVISAALREVIADQCGPRLYRAVEDLLARAAPRLSGGAGDILDGADPVAGTIAAVQRMQDTVLPIQGPPGTGKTYLTARAILALVRQGARVAVASNSHDAISNVLLGCLATLTPGDPDIDLIVAHKIGQEDALYPEDCPIHRAISNYDGALARAQVVGGTAFFLAKEENIQAFDWLFVDEAGQVGLANMAAMGRAARNIVLVGDPRQLPQVIQGAHLAPANLSCLDWMLGDHASIPPDRGVFLPTSRRMHPQVCGFISDQVYEGRLSSHPDTARQSVTGPLPQAGAFWVPVPHEGNAQIAPEEVRAILQTVAALTASSWTDKQGQTRPLTQSDIIVVAPYNAQVSSLRAALPDMVRVGTVDKFQGQEAPVCLVSMRTLSSFSTAPAGTRRMRFASPTTSPCCRSRHTPRNSTRSKTSGPTCAPTASPSPCSKPTRTSGARCCDAWNFFANDIATVRSITTREYVKEVNG